MTRLPKNKKTVSAPMSRQALLGAWRRAQTMTAGEFSLLNCQIESHIGCLFEYRERLEELGHHDLVSYLCSILTTCGLRPLGSRDLLDILLNDPRSTFRTVPPEWLQHLYTCCPTSIQQMHLLWTDSRLTPHHREIVSLVLLENHHLVARFYQDMHKTKNLNEHFMQWLRQAALYKGLIAA